MNDDACLLPAEVTPPCRAIKLWFGGIKNTTYLLLLGGEILWISGYQFSSFRRKSEPAIGLRQTSTQSVELRARQGPFVGDMGDDEARRQDGSSEVISWAWKLRTTGEFLCRARQWRELGLVCPPYWSIVTPIIRVGMRPASVPTRLPFICLYGTRRLL